MKITKMLTGGVLAAGLVLGASVADAAVTFDPDTGSGFVGKGDVQDAFGWNNKQLQDHANSLEFRVSATTVTELSWECTNSHNDNVQDRAQTTTTSVDGVVATVARTRNQVTGFELTGFSGATETSSSTEGNELNTCPNGRDWSLTTPAGDPVVLDGSTGGLEVSIDGSTWLAVG